MTQILGGYFSLVEGATNYLITHRFGGKTIDANKMRDEHGVGWDIDVPYSTSMKVNFNLYGNP